MKDFEYWMRLLSKEKLEEFSADKNGLLWLKLKSIMRKNLVFEFAKNNHIILKQKMLAKQFVELYNILANNPAKSHDLLNKFMTEKNKNVIVALNTTKLESELYKLQSFDWGGDYQNSLDKYLVSHYVKTLQSYNKLMSKFKTEISKAVQGYVLNSWYNHWSSVLIEHLFKSHKNVLPTVGKIKHVDFFIRDIPFDLKVTYLPAEYIKARRKALGLPIELTYLKANAKRLKINYDKTAKGTEVYYEIIEKLKDKGTKECKLVVQTLKKETMQILNEAQRKPDGLAKWLYENQGEMRFGSENRLFLVLVDTKDFIGSWKLKRNMTILKPAIKQYLDGFAKKNIANLKINFRHKSKSQTFTALTDILFVVK